MRVLGENYTLDDEEDSKVGQVGRLWILEARYVQYIHVIEYVPSLHDNMKMMSYIKLYLGPSKGQLTGLGLIVTVLSGDLRSMAPRKSCLLSDYTDRVTQ